MSTQPTSVTVSVVVKNRKEWMARCLDAIDAQDGAFDILVIDNESDDGTYEYLLERRASSTHRLTVVQEPGSLGHIRNTALRLAAGDVIAFTDSDCVPDPGWVTAGLAGFGELVAVVQGRTKSMRLIDVWEAGIDIPEFSNRYETCNIFYDRHALLAAGGFDETMPQIGEDVAAGWRLRENGWRAVFAHDAVVAHEVTTPGFTWWVRRGWRYECWPRLVKEFPEVRKELLFGRYFLNRHHPRVAAAAAGIIAAVATVEPWPLVLAVPLLWRWRPRYLGFGAIKFMYYGLGFDAATLAGLIRGSVRTGRLVL